MFEPELLEEGSSHPRGATPTDGGVNFALFSAHATKVEVCIYDESGEHEIARIALPEYTDEVWHGFVPGLGPAHATATASTDLTSRRRATASTRTSCCSTPTPRPTWAS